MALQRQQDQLKRIELRRIVEFNKKSKSVGVSIPSEWAELLHLFPKEYVRMELDPDNDGIHMKRILFQEPSPN